MQCNYNLSFSSKTHRDPGEFLHSVGRLTYQPSSEDSEEIVNELSTLITSGRLSDANKQVENNVCDQEPNQTAALMMAQQIIILSPEFTRMA